MIFMITAPTLKEGFQVSIPEASETDSVHIQDARVVTVTTEGFVLKPLRSPPTTGMKN